MRSASMPFRLFMRIMHVVKRNVFCCSLCEITMAVIDVKACVNISLMYCNESDSSSSSSSVESDEHFFRTFENEDEYILNSELEILYAVFMVGETRGETVYSEKISDYVERVIPGYSRHIFKEHFRMFPETFEEVLRIISPGLRAIDAAGKNPIPIGKQLLIAIWFMATLDSYKSVSIKFGIGKGTAFRALRRITYTLHCIAPRLIQWPRDQIATKVIEQFQKACGFPNVIGAIDGTHIKIRAPKVDPVSYINRNGFHSINVQLVCNSRGLFTHCFAGHVGSVHDARIFRNSPVADFLAIPDVYFLENSHLIGDAAYGIHPHLMVPYRNNGHLTNRQKNFNYCLSSTRMAIERAIGQLKIRFRILLDCLPLTDVQKIPEFILACCVLHNVCILKDDLFDVGIYRDNENVVGPILHDNLIDLGNAKRIEITNTLPITYNENV